MEPPAPLPCRTHQAPTGQRAPTLSRDSRVAHACDVALLPLRRGGRSLARFRSGRLAGPPPGRHHVTTIGAGRAGLAFDHAIDRRE